MTGRRRVTFVVTDAITIEFLRDQLAALTRRGFAVTVVAGSEGTIRWPPYEGVELAVIPMARQIRPFRDVVSLARLWLFFRRTRPAIVNASTPKAALLALVSACLARVPVRVYTLRGLRLETASGLLAAIFALCERVTIAAAHLVVCVSESLRDSAVSRGLLTPAKTRVISDPGVDVGHFDPTPARRALARAEREHLGLSPGTPVLGYAGRFTPDKGFPDLLRVFDLVRTDMPETRLLLLGHTEPVDPISADDERRLGSDRSIIAPGFVKEPAPWYLLMDVLVFPSHREGLGLAALEAAASELPVVAYRVTGVVDAVADGLTGTLVPLADVQAMGDAVLRYLRDPELARTHGRNGRRRVAERYSRPVILKSLEAFYDELSGDRRSPSLEQEVP